MSNEPTTIILTAVAAECQLLLQALNNAVVIHCGHIELTVGMINKRRCAIGHSGLGKASASAALAAIFNGMTIQRVIMAGCAGAYPQSGLGIGDIAVATQEIFADEGVATPQGFLDLQQLNFTLVEHDEAKFYHRFPCDAAWLNSQQQPLHRFAEKNGIICQFGPFATLSTCSGSTTYGREIYRRTSAIAENMEGAAAAQICAHYKIPFSELRAISNMVEDRNTTKWDLPGAMQTAQRCLLYLFNQECF